MSEHKKNELKFATRNFKGVPVEYYFVEDVAVPKTELKKEVGHIIMVLDRSGSMSGSPIQEAKATIEKVFTLAEFHDTELLVSLVSYSSSGDVTTHFSRTPVQEVMKPGNRYVEEIRSIRATYLTCASQALREALKLVSNEITSIVLETDGYFNDPSPVLEQKAFEGLITDVQSMSRVMVNTIAFGGYADFNLLSRIANSCKGRMVQAASIKQVYETIHDTAALLTGTMRPVMVVPIHGASYTAVASFKQKKVNGSTTDLTILGCGQDEFVGIYRYRKVTAESWNESTLPEVKVGHLEPLYAFARAKLAEGQINSAKYAVVSTGNQTLLRAHARALTSEDLAAFAASIDGYLFDAHAAVYSNTYGLTSDRLSVLETCAILARHREGFTVDLNQLQSTYKRRGLRRLSGKWLEHPFTLGSAPTPPTFIPAAYDASPVDDASVLSVSSIDLNNNNATVNLLFTRPAVLVNASTREEVLTVAGKKLRGELLIHRNYTIVGDGSVNADALHIRISDKKLHAALVAGNVLGPAPYDHKMLYCIPLKEMSVVPYNQSFEVSAWDIEQLAQMRFLKSVCEAVGKTEPKGKETWTDEQRAELSEHHLTTALAFQPPTTNPYTNLEDAVRAGEVDSRNSFEVLVGTKHLLDVSDVPSANAFFDRRFKLKYVGAEPAPDTVKKGYAAKVTVPLALSGQYEVEVKDTARMTLTGIDSLIMPLAQSIAQKNYHHRFGMSNEAERVAEVLAGNAEAARELAKDISKQMEIVYESCVRPLVFYIGASGLLPDNFDAAPITAEELKAKYPDVKAREGATYYRVNTSAGADPLLITLSVENAWYSTEAGLKGASQIQRTAALP